MTIKYCMLIIDITLFYANHIQKESAGVKTIAHPALKALALPPTEDKQCRSPRYSIYIKRCIRTKGRQALLYRAGK